jgi:DNA-binding CsgD family transcriptional regulator
LLRGAGCCTFELDRARGGFGDFHLVGLEPGAGDYVARMNSINPRMRYSLEQPGPHVVTDHAILPERELRRHEFYDWMTRTNGTRYFVGARVLDRDRRSVFASVEYSPRQGHPDAETVAMFTRLVPHIENAWRLSALRRDLDAARQLTDALADLRHCGVVGLRSDGAVLFANALAEAAIARGDGLRYVEHRLHCTRGAADRTLQSCIEAVLKMSGDAAAGGLIAAPRANARLPLMLRVLPCGWARGPADPKRPSALVLIADPERRTIPSTGLLCALGLSEAEARIARQLAAGLTLAETAHALGVPHNTARAHLRNIFAKTQARSQVELVRILGEIARIETPDRD